MEVEVQVEVGFEVEVEVGVGVEVEFGVEVEVGIGGFEVEVVLSLETTFSVGVAGEIGSKAISSSKIKLKLKLKMSLAKVIPYKVLLIPLLVLRINQLHCNSILLKTKRQEYQHVTLYQPSSAGDSLSA